MTSNTLRKLDPIKHLGQRSRAKDHLLGRTKPALDVQLPKPSSNTRPRLRVQRLTPLELRPRLIRPETNPSQLKPCAVQALRSRANILIKRPNRFHQRLRLRPTRRKRRIRNRTPSRHQQHANGAQPDHENQPRP
jgi:hypothetical protein